MSRLVADDLFAGAGGWDLAADMLDIHARGIENMPAARATREAAGLITIHDDVWTFDPLAHVRHDGETNAEVYARVYAETGSGVIAGIASGLIASPPCQTFSQAGKGAGRKALDAVLALIPHVKRMTLEELREAGQAFGDDRTALVLTPLWFLMHHTTYRWAAWEQVPTVLPVWQACAEELRADGWNVWTGNLQAEQYGVAQTRRRAFFLASRDHEVTPPMPTHSRYYPRNPSKLDEGVAKWVSMAEAIDTHTHTHTHGRCGGESRHGAPGERPGSDHHRSDGQRELSVGHLPRWCSVRPATTVVGSFRPEVIAAPGYRVDVSRQNAPDSVRVTVAEAGVLQSFPADFPWQGAKGKQYLQAGNAVPPLLAMAALSAVLGEPYMPPIPINTPTHEPAQPALATL